VRAIADRLRTRLLPALLLAGGVALLGAGLLSYASGVTPGPSAQALASYRPPPTIDPGLVLPPGGTAAAPTPSFPPDRVSTRVVVPRLGIDLPVIAQPPNAGAFPLCDVALYFTALGQPGSGRATYIYAHARVGMFLPLLDASLVANGKSMIGDTVEVYTSDDQLFVYRVTEVRRHQRDLVDALNDTQGRLWLQTSEGPNDSYPKLQIVADFVSSAPADPFAAHPEAHPRQCT